MPNKFKADYDGADWVDARRILEEIRGQLGDAFHYTRGVLQDADRMQSVELKREQWAAILAHIDKLTPRRDLTEQLHRPVRSYTAVVKAIDLAKRNAERISVNEGIRRAALKLNEPQGTVKRHYNETRKALQKLARTAKSG